MCAEEASVWNSMKLLSNQ